MNNINKLVINRHSISDSKDISECMNNFLCNIGNDLQSVIPNTGDQYKHFLSERVERTFFLSPINTAELLREIKSLNPKKACGADGIGAKIILLCPDVFANNLTTIFNKALEIGEYPTLLKITKVIPLYKKGQKCQANNYRPISLLSSFNKIFEKILCKQLTNFLQCNNVLFKYQFGFRKLYSTTLALIEFTDKVRSLLDEGNYVISIFVDLTKAFDTVDHEILLYKLDRYGIRGHANAFFRSYLTDRKQFTIVNSVESELKGIGCGVPQGSVLGPLCFALYINDLHKAIGEDYLRLFADETALFSWHSNLTALTTEIKSKFTNLYNWCIANKLTINDDKTKFMLYHTINKPVPKKCVSIKTNVMDIERVDNFKYLGIYLDEILHWNKHVEYVCNPLIKFFGIFNHIKCKVSLKLSRQLYYAFIYSKIKYGMEVYGSCSSTNIGKIQTMQNKLMKLLLRLRRMTPTNELHMHLNILKVSDIYKSNVLSFVNEILSGRSPDIFKNYFILKNNQYDMRRKGQLNVPPCRTQICDKAVRVFGASQWNRLETCMLQYRFKKCFKKQLLKYYLSRYNV